MRISVWSSDLCSSDLLADVGEGGDSARTVGAELAVVLGADFALGHVLDVAAGADPRGAEFGEALADVDLGIGVGVGAAGVVDADAGFARMRVEVDLAHRHKDFWADAAAGRARDVDLAAAADRHGGDADLVEIGRGNG